MTGVVESYVCFGTKGSKVKITKSVTPMLVEAGKSKSVLSRVTIRQGFPGHVLFLAMSGRPGGFSKIGCLSGFLAQSASTFERCQLQRRTTA